MRSRHVLPSLAVVVCFAACGPAPAPEVPPPPPPPPPPPAGPTVVSPARWLGRHPEEPVPVASRKLPGGGTLHGGEHGDRWISPDGPAPAPATDGGAPRLETASSRLPERIAAIALSNGKWAFFGVSGRAFLASTPLGPIDEVRAAPAPVRSLGAGIAAVMAVTQRGDLLRSTDGGAQWSPVPAPALAGAVPYSLAMRPDGVGVLQALPQRALVTTDDGATWTPIALPAGGPYRVELSEEGAIWLASAGWDGKRGHRLDGKPPAFVAQPEKSDAERAAPDRDVWRYEADSDTQRAVGKKYGVSTGRPNNSDPWKVKVSEWDREGEWKAVHELEGCDGSQTAVAAWDDEIVLGCAREEKPPPSGATLPAYRLALYRSKDGGATWAEDGGAPLWSPSSTLLAGPGGWLLLSRACPDEASACSPHAVRPAAGQPFARLPIAPDTSYEAWAIDPPHHRLVALTSGGNPKAVRVQTWDEGGKEGKTTELFATTSDLLGSVAIDGQGAIVVAAEIPDEGAKKRRRRRQYVPNLWKLFRSTDDGATFSSAPLALPVTAGIPAGISGVWLAGDRGIAVDIGLRLWETADTARTFVPVTGLPVKTNQNACTSEGCMLGPELRHGWDLASAGAPPPPAGARVEPPPRVPGTIPLRCAAGEGKEIASVLLDEVDSLLTPLLGDGKLLIPVAGKGLSLDLLVAGAAEGKVTTKATPVFPAAPNRAAIGSHTDVLLSAAGVFASRSTYPVDSAGADVWISPVTAEVAWWRPRDGKVVHGHVPPLGKGQMRGTFAMGERRESAEDLFWLGPDVAYYRPDVARAQDLFTFADKGAPTRTTARALRDARQAVRTSSGLALLATGASQDGTMFLRFAFASDKSEDAGVSWAVAPQSDAPQIVPIQRGADGAVVVTWSDADGPARGFLLPLKPGDAPTEVKDLGLASLLGQHPRACGEGLDPASVRLRIPLPRASRRATLVAVGPEQALLRVEAATIVVPPQGEPCVSEWIGHRDRDRESDLVIVPVSDPKRAWFIAAGAIDGQDGLHARTLTLHAARCEEAPGLAIPEALEFKGF